MSTTSTDTTVATPTVATSVADIYTTVSSLIAAFKTRTITPNTLIPLILEIATEARNVLTAVSNTTVVNVVVSTLQVLLPEVGLTDTSVTAIIQAVPLIVQG